MINATYFAQHEIHNRERAIARSAERRRLAAEGVPEKPERRKLAVLLAGAVRLGRRPALSRPSC